MGRRGGWRFWRQWGLADALDKKPLCDPARVPPSQALRVPFWEMSRHTNGVSEEVFLLFSPQGAEETPRTKRPPDFLPSNEDHLLFLGQEEVKGASFGLRTPGSGREGGHDLRETDL